MKQQIGLDLRKVIHSFLFFKPYAEILSESSFISAYEPNNINNQNSTKQSISHESPLIQGKKPVIIPREDGQQKEYC